MSIISRWDTVKLKWLNKRVPPKTEHVLNMRNIFIFPSRFGWLFFILCIGLFLLGTNYQNNLMLFLCYTLLSLSLIILFVTYTNLSGIKIKAGVPPLVCEGDQLHIPLRFINKHTETRHPKANGILHLALWPRTIEQTYDFNSETQDTHLLVSCPARGYFSLPRLTLSSYYPLGIFRCWTHLSFGLRYYVFPKPVACETLIRVANESDTSETAQPPSKLKHVAANEDFEGLSQHQLSMPMHRIAWKLFAKGRGLHDKQFSSVQRETGWLSWHDYYDGDIENTLGKLCFQVMRLHQTKSEYGLILPEKTIQPGSGDEHYHECVKALATYKPHADKTQA